MRTLLSVLLIVAVVAYLLHRLATWAERRGWIYYRRDRGSALGSVMSAVDPIYNPGKSHQIEEQRRLQDDREDEEAAAPPLPGPRGTHILLQTERLTLRRFTESDVDHLFALDDDAEVMRFINGGKPTSREEIENGILPAFFSYYDRYEGYGFWAAIERTTGEFLGWFHLRPDEDAGDDEPELGYRLRRSAWGKGYATEGSRALVDKAFTELGARRVVASTMAVNTGSRRVMEKSGLRFVKTFHAEWPEVIDGSDEGDVEYALTRAEWEQQNRRGL